MDNPIFAHNLRFFRKTRGLSQQKLAVQIGLKRNNIASYEAGVVAPRAVNLLRLADFFEIDPRDMMEKDMADAMMDSDALDSEGEQAVNLSEVLQAFAHGTEDLQKVVEGFREFYRLRKANNHPVPHAEAFSNLLEIMQQLLDTNWLLLQQMTAENPT